QGSQWPAADHAGGRRLRRSQRDRAAPRQAGRRGAAVACLLQLRHVRQLRGARPRVQGIGTRRRGVSVSANALQELSLPAPAGAAAQPRAAANVRERWRMGPEARGMVLVSVLITTFGLAVLYSASAMVAVNEHNSSFYFLSRQLTGVLAGILAFMIAAKVDAERLHKWAWPLLWITIATMVACLVLPNSIAPRIHGSKRFLFGASFQPSELGK